MAPQTGLGFVEPELPLIRVSGRLWQECLTNSLHKGRQPRGWTEVMEFNDCPVLPDDTVLMVCCTWPSTAQAMAAGEAAVAAGHAACCQVGSPIHSIYRWEGRVEQAEEVPLTCKTTVAEWPALEALLQARHPYQIPEIIAWPLAHGLPAYLGWVRANASGSPTEGQ